MESKICIFTKSGQVNINPIKKCLEINNQRLSVFKLIVLSNTGGFCLNISDFYFVKYDGTLGIKKVIFNFYHTSEGIRIADEKDREIVINGENRFFIRKYSFMNRLGMVHWGGKYRLTDDDYLYEGAQAIKNMGIDKLKIYLGLKSDSTYFTDYNNKNPVDILRQENYSRVLSLGFKLIVIIYHGKPTSEWKFSDSLEIYEFEKENIKNVAIELGKYKDTEFIITNWEGDCMIGADKTKETYSRMTNWVKVRQHGVNLANQKNVKHGIEVNFVRQSIPSIGHPSVLTEVVPYVDTDYVSYSCYDCKNESEFGECLKLVYKLSNRPVIVGEFGTPVNVRSSEESLEYLKAIVNITERYHTKACFYWQIYENEFKIKENGDVQPMGFGVIGHDSKVNGIWALLQFF